LGSPASPDAEMTRERERERERERDVGGRVVLLLPVCLLACVLVVPKEGLGSIVITWYLPLLYKETREENRTKRRRCHG
jgi:hypothetical protein